MLAFYAMGAEQMCAQARIIIFAKQRRAQRKIAGRESRHPHRSHGLADKFCLSLKSPGNTSLLSLLSHRRHGFFFLIDKAKVSVRKLRSAACLAFCTLKK